jgi:hypothetical protein
MPLTQLQQTVLSLTSAALFSHSAQLPHDLNWAELYQESRQQAVFPLVYSVVKNDLPQEERKRWSDTFYQTMASNLRVNYEHTELHNLMKQAKIPYVILKGAASASYYPKPELRTMGDVDFLIQESDFPRAKQCLELAGFAPEEDHGGIHVGYQRVRSRWEMHRSINGIPNGEIGNLCRSYLDEILTSAVETNFQDSALYLPDTLHHGFVLLLHTASHLTSEGVGLRHLCDWAVFYSGLSDEKFRNLFEDKLKACGLWRFAQLLTLTSIQYLHAPKRSWSGTADPVLLESLIADILTGGNFGQKDADRYRQIKYISNRGEHTVDRKNIILQAWDTLGKKAKAAHKSRAGVLLDYLGMVRNGERKLDTPSTVKSAERRREVYRELRLFEPE